MTIFVDELFTATPRTAQARSHGNRWSHMTCDGSLEELHQMAEQLGLKRSYFQEHHLLPHYDLVPSKRALAVRLGAVETTTEERVKWAIKKREERADALRELTQMSQEFGLSPSAAENPASFRPGDESGVPFVGGERWE